MTQQMLFAAAPVLGEVEAELREQGKPRVVGVDEAGRGPLAGPVVVAAVCFPPGAELPGLDDSKKLTERRRERLFEPVKELALAWDIAIVDATRIDAINILQATFEGMRAAVLGVVAQLAESDQVADMVVIDGKLLPRWDAGPPAPHRAVIKGDQRSANIAAASILAKVTRDRLMVELDAVYPGYGFAKHKGYPTAEHRKAIVSLGPSAVHRLTFGGVREHTSRAGGTR